MQLHRSEFHFPILTMTGFDEEMPPVGVIETLMYLKSFEIGILYSVSRGEDPDQKRYPPRAFIARMLERHERIFKDRYAIHICGSAARSQLLHKELDDLIKDNIRIQVNGVVQPEIVMALCDLYPNNTIITQHNNDNLELVGIERANHSLLVDSSAGQGLSPRVWERPDTDKVVGYAGGLGSWNLKESMARFEELAQPLTKFVRPYWVDMETSLRDPIMDLMSPEECYRNQLVYLETLAHENYDLFGLWDV